MNRNIQMCLVIQKKMVNLEKHGELKEILKFGVSENFE